MNVLTINVLGDYFGFSAFKLFDTSIHSFNIVCFGLDNCSSWIMFDQNLKCNYLFVIDIIASRQTLDLFLL